MSRSSVETFLSQVNSGKSKKDAVRIYRFIKRHPNCHKDTLIKELKIPHQTVTARLSGLIDLGVVEYIGVYKMITGSVSLLRIQEDVTKIKLNAAKREQSAYQKWLKKGERFKHLMTA